MSENLNQVDVTIQIADYVRTGLRRYAQASQVLALPPHGFCGADEEGGA